MFLRTELFFNCGAVDHTTVTASKKTSGVNDDDNYKRLAPVA